MFFLQFISKFIKVLRAGESPPLIASGFTLGFLVGLTPFMTLQNMVILLIAFLTKVNLAAVFFGIFFFGFIAFIFDPVFHNLGYFMLAKLESLYGLWTTLYNLPVAPLTRFNNTVVLGSLLTAVVLAFPVYLLSQKGIIAYRENWAEKIENSKFVKALKGTFIFKWYAKVRDLEI
jgi:uncharacterized protein (TIGR03546 family)